MSNPFAIKHFREDGLSIICLEGYLDAHTAPQFEDTIQSELDDGHNRIVVDCQKLDYVSSAGLGVFMGFIEEIREQEGGDLKVCGLTPKVKEVFDILGFSEIFEVFENIPAARRQFSPMSGTGATNGND